MKRTSRQSLMRFNNILSKSQYISLKWNDWLNWWMNNFLDGSKDLLSLKRVKTTDICDSHIWEKAIQQFCKISHGLVDKLHDCMHKISIYYTSSWLDYISKEKMKFTFKNMDCYLPNYILILITEITYFR